MIPPGHLPSPADGRKPGAASWAAGVATCGEGGWRGWGSQTLARTLQFEDKNFLRSELCHKFAKKQQNVFFQKSDHVLSVLFKLIKINNI